MNESCGYCSGRGFIFGSMFDRDGRQRYAEPPQLACEYCGGSGQCVDGHRLLAAVEPREEASTGNPTWA